MAHRILQIGEFETPQYDEAMARAFESLGHTVRRFKHYDYRRPKSLFDKVQNRLLTGPNYWRLWRDVLVAAEEFKPDIIYYRRPNELPPKVMVELRKTTGAIVVSYQNDDPFGLDRHKHFFKNFHRTIPYYDVHFVFRTLNIEDLRKSGVKDVEVLLPYYVAEMHHDRTLSDIEKERFRADAIFLGHGEADNRVDAFNGLIEAGLGLKLGGSGFEKYAKGHPHERLLPASYYGKDIYSQAIKGANCALCFFSKLNRDVLTTRVFEIPACGGVLVAERNQTIETFFKDKEEAFFFSSTDELVGIVQLLKNDPQLREAVAQRGRERLLNGKHEVHDRAQQIIQKVESL